MTTADEWVAAWLARLRPGARPAYHATLLAFAEATQTDPAGLVKQARQDHGYPMLGVVQAYILALPGDRAARQWTYAALRSFFAHCRVDLPRDAAFMLRLNA